MVSLNSAQTLVKSCGGRLEFHVLLAKSEIMVEGKFVKFMCLFFRQIILFSGLER